MALQGYADPDWFKDHNVGPEEYKSHRLVDDGMGA